MVSCSVCDAALGEPIYESPPGLSITTMNKLIPGRTRVRFCDACLHLQTDELPDLEAFYAHEYEINLSSEDDDQIYEVVDGQPVFRADHQAAVLLDKLELPEGARILDYGCAKAPTLKKLCVRRPDLRPHMFDVTDKYVPFWERFPTAPSYAVGEPDPAWAGTLDVVLSFYALEHVADLAKALGRVRELLRPGGRFYFIVPNAYGNIADFVVADHINHFSATSLRVLLTRAGFEDVDVDAEVHRAAFVVHATAGAGAPEEVADDEGAGEASSTLRERTRADALAMADYWGSIRGRIGDFVSALPAEAPVAIYGAGFYGAFVASVAEDSLADGQLRCFVDQNPHLHGTLLRGRPVAPPAELPDEVGHVLVGLNPRTAERAIGDIEAWKPRDLTFLFL